MFNKKVNNRHEVMFAGEHYAIVRAVTETMGLKVKEFRGNMFRGKYVGLCRVVLKANEDELNSLLVKLNNYGAKEAFM